MVGNTTFLLGRPIFRGELLVSGRVDNFKTCFNVYENCFQASQIFGGGPGPSLKGPVHCWGTRWDPDGVPSAAGVLAMDTAPQIIDISTACSLVGS